MADDTILHLLVDTSFLRTIGFNNPDFRKLLHYSQQGVVRILVPHIVWEERRTQLTDKTLQQLRKVRDGLEALKAPWLSGLVTDGLIPTSLQVCPDSEVDTRSKVAMAEFARLHKIEIVPIAPDHADRAWTRYFEIGEPFDGSQEREDRRKDIPDSWIFEVAIDLKKQHAALCAACGDGKLSKALAANGIKVYREIQPILEVIYASERPQDAVASEPPTTSIPDDGPSVQGKLELAIARANSPFKGLESKILGYVGYLGSPSKDQLFGLLSSSGISADIARNAAERLAFEGLIKDTGNHYLPEDDEVCALASSLVEAEIIALLDRS